MLQKPSGCSACPLRDKGKGFVPDQLAPNADYIMFGEAPGGTEVETGKPFQGRAGFVLKNWLIKSVPMLQLASERNKISYCNVLRCLPPEIQGRAYPKGEEKLQAEACCSQYLDMGNAHTVILFGESPQRRFFGPELAAEDADDKRLGHDLKGVGGRIGRVIERDGKRFVFAPHPAWILRQPALVTHGQMALRIAVGAERMLEPEYVPWDRAIRELTP